uniref:Protein phosphatase 1 regulatory subunit 18 n=1 Tax=Paramormyrops kingsleyae TaxID=1676925 RepID=A0A3B3SK49_9TELE
MSIPSLPEWKRLLLDRKRKGEETRERQVREDEKRLANMPAWKREVIQRRKAKQEGDGGPQTVDGRVIAENTSEAALPKDSWSTCAQGFRNGPEPQSQVSVENIGPVQHNPFVLSQNVWRGDRRECREDLGPDNSAEGGVRRTGEGDPSKEEQSEEFGSCQRDIDCDGEKHQNVKCKRMGNGGDGLRRKGGGDREQKDPGTEYPVCSLSVPCLRTIQAEHVITAELEISATGKKALGNKRREEEMKPSASVKDRSEACQPMYGERKGSRSGTGANEERHEKEEVINALGEKEAVPGGDKARSRMKVGRIWPNVQVKTGEKAAKADRSIREDMEAGASAENLGHVSRLLSKFGEQYKCPLRSKSMDCFTSHDEGGGRGSMEEESALRERESWAQRKEEREEVQGFTVKGVPMRSFRFSKHVVSDTENRADDEDCIERKVVELKYSGRWAPQMEGCQERRRVKGDEWGHSEMVHQGRYQLSMQREPGLPKETGVGEDPDVGEGVSELGGMGKAPEKEWDRERADSSGLVKGIDALAVLGTRDTEMTLRYNEERKDGKMERAWLGAAQRMPRESEMAHREEEEKVPAVSRKEQPHRNINAVPERQDILGKEKFRNESLFTERTDSYHTASKRLMCDMDHHSCLPEGRSREKKPESGDGGACTTLAHGPFHGGGKADMDGALSRSHADRENTEGILDGNQDRAVASTMDSSKAGNATAMGEVLIPRTHFYVRERGSKLCVAMQGKQERGKVSVWGGNWEAGQSLQEAIGQSGPEKVMEGEGESRIGLGSRWEAYAREEEDMQGKERKMEEGGRRELERALRVREVVDQQQVSREGKETVISTGSERVGKIQRGPCVYTSSSLGVIQEVGLPKPSPPLPANVSPSQLLLAAKAEARASSAATPVAAASPHIQERQEQERQHVEDSESSQKGRRFTEEGGKEEEECAQSPSPSLTTSIDVPPSSSSPTLPFVVNMSRIYNQKPVVPRSTLSIGERKTENMSPTLKAQGRESPLQSHRLPLTQDNLQPKGEILEQQSLPRMELKPTWWQACQRKPKEEMNTRGQEAQMQTVQQQVKLLKLEAEPQASSEASNQQELLKGSHLGLKDSSKPSPLLQQYQKVNQQTFPKDQETSNGTKPTQQLSNQKLPLKQQSPNQCQPSRSFTVNPKSSPVLENPPQIQECKDVVTPSASLSPSSSSPSALPNAPLFSLRNTSAGPGKRGNTITIVPRRPPAAGKPATDPGANRTAPQTQAPISGDASKKRYPTVEEIVVIGGYKKVEKSCLSKHGKTPKGVTVCFNEAQLEHVCEYPSESAMLASLPCPPPDSEKEAEEKMGGQEEEEEEEEETGAFALSSKRMAVGKSRVLRVG